MEEYTQAERGPQLVPLGFGAKAAIDVVNEVTLLEFRFIRILADHNVAPTNPAHLAAKLLLNISRMMQDKKTGDNIEGIVFLGNALAVKKVDRKAALGACAKEICCGS